MSVVLIVDDDPLICATLSLMLQAEEFETLEAASASKAIQLSEQHRPNLAIVDHGLPDQPGDELAVTLQLKGIPCILFTGMNEQDALNASLRAGTIAHLVKPVDMGTLLTTVRNALAHCEGPSPPRTEPFAG